MKSRFLIPLLILFCSVITAKIWRVDLNAKNKPDFTLLQEANDDNKVSDGDTLYVAGNIGNYGSLTVSKKLVIIGQGYFLPENNAPQVNKFSSKLYDVDIRSSGSQLVGMEINGSLRINASNILIKRNHIISSEKEAIILNSLNSSALCVDHLSIEQNFIESNHLGIIYGAIAGITSEQIFITNNFISTKYTAVSLLNIRNVAVANNTIKGNLSLSDANIYNNILMNNGSTLNLRNCFFQRNIGIDYNQFEGDNKIAIFNQIFVDTGSPDGMYQLKESSPAKGYAVNGDDCGMFGGDEPYLLSGIPPIPTIYEAQVAPSGNNMDGLTVKIKVKANK